VQNVIIGVVFLLQVVAAVWTWIFYKNAKRDLNARTAEAPVLKEVTALQRSVKELLSAIEEASQETTARLEVRCAEARFVLGTLEERLSQIEVSESVLNAHSETLTAPVPLANELTYQVVSSVQEEVAYEDKENYKRHQVVYGLADTGLQPRDIAHQTGIAEGEVHLLLTLRNHSEG